ncbi:redoxin domain-containing protein [Nocardioides guangzhouensis]|uniref:Redoxin domain-containing protein n=2 Tax=Nocardioides guangzhouensis TaxID=2497878 RepID=A0A4Q4ZKB0_9ACTN|nr:redoxin domain-containing protein [Nocardioides guangzhouensis]
MSSVWDGRRLLVHDPEEYRPWILYEAPEEHPDALDQVTGWRVDPTSATFESTCPSAAPIGHRTILGRTAVGYRCGPIHTPQYDREARSIWLDEKAGLLLVDPPISATAIEEHPVITRSTFSTRPPAGSEVTVYGAKEGEGQPGRAPGFRLERLDGGTARLADYAGRPVVLAFFASDIVFDPAGEECRRCIPSLLDLQRETSGGAHPAVLAVQGGDRGKPGHLMVPRGLRLPVANDPGYDVQHSYGLEQRVGFAFIAADGTLRQVIDGPATAPQLRAALDRLH